MLKLRRPGKTQREAVTSDFILKSRTVWLLTEFFSQKLEWGIRGQTYAIDR